MFNIVLFEPEIPQNTGNIARLSLATDSKLFLKQPLGFSLDDKYLKRAGLDYWQHVNYTLLDSLDPLISENHRNTFYFLTTKTNKSYLDFNYHPGDFFVFGPESRGLPSTYRDINPMTIPMNREIVRSLNLSTSVGIIIYEALRQNKALTKIH